jgi:hypothetical protein
MFVVSSHHVVAHHSAQPSLQTESGHLSTSQTEPATGDMQEGPPISITDNAIVQTSHVASEPSKYHDVETYTTEKEDSEVQTWPFIHPVELRGEKGIPSKVDGLFDEGAMVSSICNTVFPTLRGVLGALTPSLRTLRMADGTQVPSQGC